MIAPGANPSRCRGAFTLVELLVVLAIVGVLASLALPGLGSLMKAHTFDQTLSTLTGTLEQARQYAVAQNTYVWVAFALDNTNARVNAAVFASPDGTDSSTSWTGTLAANSSTLVPIAKIQSFSYINLVSPNGTSTSRTVVPASVPSSVGQPLNNSTASFTITLPGQSSATTFNYALQFTPSGEARVQDGTPVDFIEFAVQSMKGAGIANANNGAVIQVNGLTGENRIYRQ